MTKDLNESIREMVRRDMLRSCRQLEGQRPGQPVEDGKVCCVHVAVSVECWSQVYGTEIVPPDSEEIAVQAFYRYHEGKREWELLHWFACLVRWETPDGATHDTLPAEQTEVVRRLVPITDPQYSPWGVGTLEWKRPEEVQVPDVVAK